MLKTFVFVFLSLFVASSSFGQSSWDRFEETVSNKMEALGNYGAALAGDVLGSSKSSVKDFATAKKHLRKIYVKNKQDKTLYCEARFDKNGKISLPEGFILPFGSSQSTISRAHRLEWEHVVPAENFGRNFTSWRNGDPQCGSKRGRECARKVSPLFNEMEGDMHNLFPSVGAVNELRSNYPFVQFEKNVPSTFGTCAMKIYDRKAEPPDAAKGIVARASLYMQEKGANSGMNIFSKQRLQLFEAWDAMYPPTAWECKRNTLIKAVQGNENTFISRQCL